MKTLLVDEESSHLANLKIHRLGLALCKGVCDQLGVTEDNPELGKAP
jgi:hypothetical protein